MRKCCREFEEEVEETVAQIGKFREETVGKLRAEMEEAGIAVEAAVFEAVSCLDQGKFPTSPLAQAIWALPVGQMGVFTYRIGKANLKGLCESWLTYHNKLNFQFQHLQAGQIEPKLQADLAITCTKCDKTYPNSLFPQLDICGCRICAYCEAEQLQPLNQTCTCGHYFDVRSIERISQMTQTCAQCHQTLNLLTSFSSIHCSDHRLCVKGKGDEGA